MDPLDALLALLVNSFVRVQTTTFIGAGGGAQLGFLRQHAWLVTKTPLKILTNEYRCPITPILPKHLTLVFLTNIFKPHHKSSASVFRAWAWNTVEQRGPVTVGANNLPCDRPATGINRLSKSNYRVLFTHYYEKLLELRTNRVCSLTDARLTLKTKMAIATIRSTAALFLISFYMRSLGCVIV